MEFANHGEGLSLCIDAHQCVLDNFIHARIEGEYRDYLGAGQAAMAIDLLMIDANLAGKYKGLRDELYRLLRRDETTGRHHSSMR
jgi:hypothetical protein